MTTANYNKAMTGKDIMNDVAYLLMANTTRLSPKKYSKVEIDGDIIKCYILNDPATKKSGKDVHEISYITTIEDVLGIQFFNTYAGNSMFNEMNKSYMTDY